MKRFDISQHVVPLAPLEFEKRGTEMLDAIIAETVAPLKIAQAALD